MGEEVKSEEVVEKVETEQVEQVDTQPEEKKFTQAEVEKMMSDRIAREKKAAEKAIEEAKKLATMNETEKKEHEFKLLQEELAELKRKDTRYGLSREASKMLAEHAIQSDDTTLQFVVKDTAEETQEAVNAFVSLVNEKVEQGVKKALAGNTPRVGVNSNGALTKEKILDIKDSKERIQAIQNNPHLFKK